MSRLVKNSILITACFAMMFSLFLTPVKAYAAGGSNRVQQLTTTSEEEVTKMINYTEGLLRSSFGDNFSITREGDLITVSIWQDGLAEYAMQTMENNAYRNEWNSMLESTRSMASALNQVYSGYNLNTAVNLLNDVNRTNALVSFYNGMLVYDATSQQ